MDCKGHLLPAAGTTETGTQIRNCMVLDIPPETRNCTCVEPLDSFETPGATENDQSTPELTLSSS